MNPRARRHRRHRRQLRRSEHARVSAWMVDSLKAARCSALSPETFDTGVLRAHFGDVAHFAATAKCRHPAYMAERTVYLRVFGIPEPSPKVVAEIARKGGG